MTLSAGARLGPYEILGLIGAGGMGEVYKARDTRLERTVAIKILPADISDDPNRRARFEREAKNIGTLSHPHICTLHDVGEQAGSLFLVMEHLAGETLAERLQKGALPTDVALNYCVQVADALSAAHRAGIIHRDLKPGNIMLTKSGVKLLDFGLAKVRSAAVATVQVGAGAAPTVSEPLTGAGTILGTLPYMAPEQIEGKEPDIHTDIWALGLVLYEMITGRRAFDGESSAMLMGAILERTPTPVASLQPQVPSALDRVVRRCLAKSPDDRWDSAHDVADELRWIATFPERASEQDTPRRVAFTKWVLGACVLIAVMTVVALIALWPHSRQPNASLPLVQRYELSIAPAESLRGADEREMSFYAGRPSRLALAISPDEHWLVFSAIAGTRQGLWVRDIVKGEVRFLANTEGAEGPFFSPDGRQVGFWANGAMKKIDLAGGPATTICETEPLQGAVWAGDGTIIFGRLTGPLLRVADSGGTPVPITKLQERETVHWVPQLLPNGRTVLYSTDPWPYRTIAEDLQSHKRVELLRGDTTRGEIVDARYVATGHLIYARRGTLEAVPLNVESLTLTGAPVVVVGDVMQSWGGGSTDLDTGVMQAVVSRLGSLYYLPGGVVPPASSTLVWRDLSGRREVLTQLSEYVETVRISPDGTRAALQISSYQGAPLAQIAILDLKTKTVMPVTDPGGYAGSAIWSPDGQRLTFEYTARPAEQPVTNLFTMLADASGPPERLMNSEYRQLPQSWTPDSGTLIYDEQRQPLRDDLWSLRSDSGATRIEPLLQTDDREMSAQVSPDGRWLAYQVRRITAGEGQSTGSNQVYVRRLSPSQRPIRVSVEGGAAPVWAPDSRTLYYTSARRDVPGAKAMMAVEMVEGRPVPGKLQRELFTGTWFSVNAFRSYDLSPDGTRFLFPVDVAPSPQAVSRIQVVVNWIEELRARARPAK